MTCWKTSLGIRCSVNARHSSLLRQKSDSKAVPGAVVYLPAQHQFLASPLLCLGVACILYVVVALVSTTKLSAAPAKGQANVWGKAPALGGIHLDRGSQCVSLSVSCPHFLSNSGTSMVLVHEKLKRKRSSLYCAGLTSFNVSCTDVPAVILSTRRVGLEKGAYLFSHLFGLLGQKYDTEDLAPLSPQRLVTYCSPKCSLPSWVDLEPESASGDAAPGSSFYKTS